ncbi:MAG TPA: nuclear transport factor 2 family protein [Burkholderiaceae bacterium]|nr:nuclear transport factor 2 family protein [Burkholderiaceae bacterium]
MARTAQEIFRHHGEAMDAQNIDAIVEDYTERSVLIVGPRIFRGKSEIRAFFKSFLDTLPEAEWSVPIATFEGNVLYIEWAVKSRGRLVAEGADTFVFADGMIAVQTAHPSPTKARSNAA